MKVKYFDYGGKMVKKTATCTVYIDESGDLGVRKGTKWFVLSAVIINKTDEKNIREIMDQIKTKLNIKEIHLKKVQDFFKRAFIVQELNQSNFVYTNVVFDTDKFDTSKIPNPIVAYNYICKYLLQRVSMYLENTKQVADIVLSARGTSRDQELIDYINYKLLPYPANSIKKSHFNKVEAKTAAQWDMLQLADVCATTMYLKHQKNTYGFSTPCFAKAISKHLFSKNNKVDTYGIKYFIPAMKPSVNELEECSVCTKKERISGATTT